MHEHVEIIQMTENENICQIGQKKDKDFRPRIFPQNYPDILEAILQSHLWAVPYESRFSHGRATALLYEREELDVHFPFPHRIIWTICGVIVKDDHGWNLQLAHR